ncbi:MAG: NAD(P)H-dependent oxidoreductase, partial [Puniceicoccales bacterium]|nr:NAD(P)H-dependent oxidoreductase [Puniceicoccales bacterium]
RIQKMINADIFEIKTVETYPHFPVNLARYFLTAKKPLKNNKLPQLKGRIPDIGTYDLIIIGSPVWWYTLSAPMISFLSRCDFRGKTVVTFATYDGSPGNFFNDFRKHIKNAKVIDGIGFRNVSGEKSEILNEKILNWLNELRRRK